MYYFAYGSNMSRARLEDRLLKVDDLGMAVLTGYKIAFNKLSSLDGSGKTNIVSAENENVVGVVFDLTEEQFELLDQSERGYTKAAVNVALNEEVVSVHTYFANENRIDNNLQPTQAYRKYLIDGAKEHNFPSEYVEMLESVPVQDQ